MALLMLFYTAFTSQGRSTLTRSRVRPGSGPPRPPPRCAYARFLRDGRSGRPLRTYALSYRVAASAVRFPPHALGRSALRSDMEMPLFVCVFEMDLFPKLIVFHVWVL